MLYPELEVPHPRKSEPHDNGQKEVMFAFVFGAFLFGQQTKIPCMMKAFSGIYVGLGCLIYIMLLL
jgi:hypothetical protein